MDGLQQSPPIQVISVCSNILASILGSETIRKSATQYRTGNAQKRVTREISSDQPVNRPIWGGANSNLLMFSGTKYLHAELTNHLLISRNKRENYAHTSKAVWRTD